MEREQAAEVIGLDADGAPIYRAPCVDVGWWGDRDFEGLSDLQIAEDLRFPENGRAACQRNARRARMRLRAEQRAAQGRSVPGDEYYRSLAV
jgi:hypothetical protein